ncbi:DUF4232 domain-containing protein [Actinomadura sp. KC216]|uniref:DUF4232 domain-containing protein n=1 Tax=Actinomadura sp. KC216 TaxID=2530370 RepID=UPI00104C9831|nr:DUF4232 domain-containing protein [Actinomadura sp. KC216]TDB90565.1 DUF4232 domain-containing protein [Actinomadura sp. KC216]
MPVFRNATDDRRRKRRHGLRVIGLRLTNCGSRAYHLNGFPLLQLLDEDRKPEPTVKILKGSGGIATMSDFDAPARPVVLEPGQTANSGLMWRNTTDAGGAPVNVPYVRVRAKPGNRSSGWPWTAAPTSWWLTDLAADRQRGRARMLVAIAAPGNTDTAVAVVNGMQMAVIVAPALSVAGALVALAVPSTRKATATQPDTRVETI